MPCVIRRSPVWPIPRHPRQRRRQAALAALTEAAKTGEGNLLDLAVKAVRLRATVGEISDALEVVFGRYRANPQAITGVLQAVVEGDETGKALKADIEAFVEEEGRRPRIMIAKLGPGWP
jgi:methylmalonyl-CoA mutase